MHVNLCKLCTLEVVTFESHIPAPVGVRAEITADNTSIRVTWEWLCQGVLMCVDLVRVHYQPEGGSLMMYTVSNTTATSATLPNLQCNTRYAVWVYVASGSDMTVTMSAPRMVSQPARGTHIMYITFHTVYNTSQHSVLLQPLPLPVRSLLGS